MKKNWFANELYRDVYINWTVSALLLLFCAVLLTTLATIVAVLCGASSHVTFYLCLIVCMIVFGRYYKQTFRTVGMYECYPLLFLGKPTGKMVQAGYWSELYPIFSLADNQMFTTEWKNLETKVFIVNAKDGPEIQMQLRIPWQPQANGKFTKTIEPEFLKELSGRLTSEAGNLGSALEFYKENSVLRGKRNEFSALLRADSDFSKVKTLYGVNLGDPEIMVLDAVKEADELSASEIARTKNDVKAAAEKVQGASAAIQKLMTENPGMSYEVAKDTWEMATGKKEKITYEGLDKTNTVSVLPLTNGKK